MNNHQEVVFYLFGDFFKFNLAFVKVGLKEIDK